MDGHTPATPSPGSVRLRAIREDDLPALLAAGRYSPHPAAPRSAAAARRYIRRALHRRDGSKTLVVEWECFVLPRTRFVAVEKATLIVGAATGARSTEPAEIWLAGTAERAGVAVEVERLLAALPTPAAQPACSTWRIGSPP